MGMNGFDSGQLTVRAVGGPTTVLELGGLRFMTDPTFDPPGTYEPRPGVLLTKTKAQRLSLRTSDPSMSCCSPTTITRTTLDDAGRAFLADVPCVLTTISGAKRLGAGATALGNWETVKLQRPDGGTLKITGVPAQHGPDGTDHLTGEVTGFLLSAEDAPTVYVSGDNASLDVVRRIVDRLGKVDGAGLLVGGAQLPYLGDAYLTLPSASAPDAARILDARTVVPVHFDGWQHFSTGPESLHTAFNAAGLGDRLALLEPGDAITI